MKLNKLTMQEPGHSSLGSGDVVVLGAAVVGGVVGIGRLVCGRGL